MIALSSLRFPWGKKFFETLLIKCIDGQGQMQKQIQNQAQMDTSVLWVKANGMP